jgi:hypothetical protein
LGGKIWLHKTSKYGTDMRFKIKAKVHLENENTDNFLFMDKKMIGIYDSKSMENRSDLSLFLIDKNSIPIIFTTEQETIFLVERKKFDSIIIDHTLLTKTITNIIDKKIGVENTIILVDNIKELSEDIKNKYPFRNIIPKPVKQSNLLAIYKNIFLTKKPYDIIYQDHHNLDSIKILIDEDVYINQRVIQDFLIKLGYNNIKIVNNGSASGNTWNIINYGSQETLGAVPTQVLSTNVSGTQNVGFMGVVIQFPNESFDSYNAWNGSEFTVPVTGTYQITHQSLNEHTQELNNWFMATNVQVFRAGIWSNIMGDIRSGLNGPDVNNSNIVTISGNFTQGEKIRLISFCQTTTNNIMKFGSLVITKL